MSTTEVCVSIDPRDTGVYEIRWKCSDVGRGVDRGVDRGGDVLVADDQGAQQWREIADIHVPGTPASVPDLVIAAMTAYSRCATAQAARLRRCP